MLQTRSISEQCTWWARCVAVNSFNVCLNCYIGEVVCVLMLLQTGTGKSHTMEGKEEPAELRGIIPNTFDYIFQRIGRESGCRLINIS